mmetsp:Transcript_27437/g.52905  ORF Transcript_27437/g.52905 Transcript_27437/m.52905 type:complete len:602 (+) Transcript_27437:84-1889(+)
MAPTSSSNILVSVVLFLVVPSVISDHLRGTTAPFSAMRPDPSLLKWDRVPTPGNMSDGTLTVHLDPDDPESPEMKLRVKMLFSKRQPAPMGPMLMHCGGPGSGTECMETHARISGFDLDGESYDIWSISQRGIAGSEPSMKCSGAKLPPLGKDKYDISDFTDCPCAHADGTPLTFDRGTEIDPDDEEQVVNLLNHMKLRSKRCYEWDKMQLKGAKGKTYNFWEWSGTQLLAYDIDTMRQAVGGEKLSIFGASYGTMVGSVYATVFPQNTQRVVLNGNVPPFPEKSTWAIGAAGGMQQAVAKLLYNCGRNSTCSMKEPETEFSEILSSIRSDKGLTAPTASGKPFRLTVGLLVGVLATLLGDNSGAGWVSAIDVLSGLSPRQLDETKRTAAVVAVLNSACHALNNHTWYTYGTCIGTGQLAEDDDMPSTDAFIEMNAIFGQDSAGRWTVEDVVHQWRAINAEYGTVGSVAYIAQMSALFNWPTVPTPVAPMGNPTVPALIVGNLYDPPTRYEWSQKMHEAFPSGSLMTWQGVGHCMLDTGGKSFDPQAIKKCFDKVLSYFKTGKLPPNGFVCRETQPLPVLIQDRSFESRVEYSTDKEPLTI